VHPDDRGTGAHAGSCGRRSQDTLVVRVSGEVVVNVGTETSSRRHRSLLVQVLLLLWDGDRLSRNSPVEGLVKSGLLIQKGRGGHRNVLVNGRLIGRFSLDVVGKRKVCGFSRGRTVRGVFAAVGGNVAENRRISG